MDDSAISTSASETYLASIEGVHPKSQQSFSQWLSNEFNAGRAPKLDGLNHLYSHALECLQVFCEGWDYELLADQFSFLRGSYPDMAGHLSEWQADAAMLTGRWSEAWDLKGRVDVNVVRTVGRHLGSQRLGISEVKSIARRLPLTSWGKRHQAEVDEAALLLIDELHRDGVNFVDAFCDLYEPRMGVLDERAAEEIFDDLDIGVDSRFLHHMLLDPQNQTRYGPWGKPDLYPFNASTALPHSEDEHGERSITTLPMVGVSWFLESALEARARWIFREAENIVRVREGMPRIGDGWISETELFELVRRSFADKRVVKHARPRWLSPQHLDVYIEGANVAIEFQGQQHFQPVDYFGGEDGYRIQTERDERKRLVCAENDCVLIEVSAGYDPYELVERLRVEILDRNRRVS